MRGDHNARHCGATSRPYEGGCDELLEKGDAVIEGVSGRRMPGRAMQHRCWWTSGAVEAGSGCGAQKEARRLECRRALVRYSSSQPGAAQPWS
jgi:hypothetical protein